MELLVKETVTLHKVLSRYLSAPIVEVCRLNGLLLLLLTVCFVVCDDTSLCRHQSPPLRRIRADRVTEPGGQGQACNICRNLYQNATSDYSKRMLADARFLHQKLSVLKNISAPTNMVETLVAEKSIPRKSTFRTTVGPNERLRGLLSRRDSTKPDKPLPSPTQPPQTAPSNGGAAGEFVADSDRVIPPPRISSRSSGAVPTRAETRTSVEGNGVQGNSMLQSEEELLENLNPISSASSLLGALREPSNGNDDDQLAAC